MERTAIVTGSTSGIGLGIAEALAASGVRVMLNGLGDAAEIEAQRERIERTTGAAVGVILEIVATGSGAVFKTIGYAAMATFPAPTPTPPGRLRLGMREAMRTINAERGRDEFGAEDRHP